ncbi:hypothetical protein TPA0910_83990 [Streptomyces hygroscopicus subsp. sporocinereus]|uniref:Uncharacterized protein n=1 Tax=Streptomyces hygroscopicus TaxID=1912 RepID=A0ABQ3UFM1_STRHY|nr:hypothetical protein TPA0910_83990 [Streptomyces hygroscopicus]
MPTGRAPDPAAGRARDRADGRGRNRGVTKRSTAPRVHEAIHHQPSPYPYKAAWADQEPPGVSHRIERSS